MSLPIKLITRNSAKAIADTTEYQDPRSLFHIKKGEGRDPHGDRRSAGFWISCDKMGLGFHAPSPLDRNAIAPAFAKLVLAAQKDDHGRLRSNGVLRKGVWNPPTDLMAQLRAIERWETRSIIVHELFNLFYELVRTFFPGPSLMHGHPDRHRLHFEVLFLVFDPETGRRFDWAKGIRYDGPGSTTLAEDPDSEFCYLGVNSRIAGKMADLLRSLVAKHRTRLTREQLAAFELRTKLQWVLLETTVTDVSLRRRERNGYQRPEALGELCRAWRAAPGNARTEAKLRYYYRKGLVSDEGMPVVPEAAREIPDFFMWVAKGSSKTPVGDSPNSHRVAWLRIWLEWIKGSLRVAPDYFLKRRIGVVETLVVVNRQTGTAVLRREVLAEVNGLVERQLVSESVVHGLVEVPVQPHVDEPKDPTTGLDLA